MAQTQYAFNFSKLLVGNLDKSGAFYEGVFALKRLAVVEDAIAGRAIKEIMYHPTHEGGATLVILSFLDSPDPVVGEAITGFTVQDLDQTLAAVTSHGGVIADPVREMPEMGIRVAFARDPEGHLIEIVQMLG